MAQQGQFTPAGEQERLRELQTFINHLQIRTHLFANSVSNFLPVTGRLPYDREKITNEIENALNSTSEQEMLEYRMSLDALG